MALFRRIRSLFSKSTTESSDGSSSLADAAEVLAEKRGDHTIIDQPPERGGYSTENVKNAARDLGPNRFTGPDSIGDVGKGYRSSK